MRLPGLVHLVFVAATLMAGPAAADLPPMPARPADWDDHPPPLPPPPPEKDPLPLVFAALIGLVVIFEATGPRRRAVPG